jgi:hypothetical protein
MEKSGGGTFKKTRDVEDFTEGIGGHLISRKCSKIHAIK